MQTTTKLGVWMDHSYAQIIEYAGETIQLNHISSEYPFLQQDDSPINERKQSCEVYYKKLAELIENYSEVILFGPTNAKADLFNLLMKDSRFANIKIDLTPTDKMTDNQKHNFVKKYFKKKN